MIYKPVSLTESQIGKYVDINGDGIPEGVIFADLAIGGDKLWNGTPNTHYRYEKSSKKLKEYVVVGTYSHALNGKREMLTPILDGEDRFYIMALNDVGKDEHCWYHKASFKGMIDYEETTLETFGSGKQNTLNMIEKWNKEDYGTQNSDDMWSLIQEQVEDGLSLLLENGVLLQKNYTLILGAKRLILIGLLRNAIKSPVSVSILKLGIFSLLQRTFLIQ